MAPKKSSASTKRDIDQVEQKSADEVKNEDQKIDDGEVEDHQSGTDVQETAEPASKKVKTKGKTKESKESDGKPNSKRATRSSAKTASKHDSKAIIKFLLSDDAITMLDQLETSDSSDFQFPGDRLVKFFLLQRTEHSSNRFYVALTPFKTSSLVAWSRNPSATESPLERSTTSSAKTTR